MRHRMETSSFGRRPNQRKALMRGLATSLLDKGRIETTLAKAKELKKVVEPLITLGKRGDLHARRQAAGYLYKREVVAKLFGEVAERFKTRPGGYTRIMQLERRRGDAAKMALIELIPAEGSKKKPSTKKGSDKKKGPAQKAEGKKVEAKKAAGKEAAPKKATPKQAASKKEAKPKAEKKATPKKKAKAKKSEK